MVETTFPTFISMTARLLFERPTRAISLHSVKEYIKHIIINTFQYIHSEGILQLIL